MTEPVIDPKAHTILLSRYLSSFKLVLGGATSMKNFHDSMHLFTEIVGQENYIQEGKKILINQTAIDLMRKAIDEFKSARSKERHRLRAIKKKESNAITNPKHNPINNPKNNPINNPKYNPINNPKNNPINNAARDKLKRVQKYEMAPPVLRCTEAVYCDEDDFIYIEMRCDTSLDVPVSYYPVDQFEKFLGYVDLVNVLQSSQYTEEVEYKYLLVHEDKKPEVFLTDDGLLTLITKSRKPGIVQLKHHIMTAIKKMIFGTPSERADIIYASADKVPAVCCCSYPAEAPGGDKLDIGSVKEVFGEKGIFEEAKHGRYDVTDRVYKIGRGINIKNRVNSHKHEYAIEGVEQSLVCSYVLSQQVLGNKTFSLEKVMFKLLDRLGCPKQTFRHKVTGVNHTEIFVMNARQSQRFHAMLTDLKVRDVPATTQSELQHEATMLASEIDALTYKLSLAEELIKKTEKQLQAVEHDRDVRIQAVEHDRDVRIKTVERDREEWIKKTEQDRDARIQAIEQDRDARIQAVETRIQAIEQEKETRIQAVEQDRETRLKELNTLYMRLLNERIPYGYERDQRPHYYNYPMRSFYK